MFKKRTPRNFNYTSRYSSEDNITRELKRELQGKRKSKASRLPFLLVVLGIIIAVMYYLETKLR